jgi:hypothetical protein
VIEIEVQNETHQTQDRIRFAAVPRIGEGIRLRAPDGIWASYDVIDVWYQKAEFGEVWMPYLHIRMTPGERGDSGDGEDTSHEFDEDAGYDLHRDSEFASLGGELEPFKI